MKKLEKKEIGMFSEYYEGRNGNIVVTCILDDNCVRYTVCEVSGLRSKRIARHTYFNRNKARCFANAEAALNYTRR